MNKIWVKTYKEKQKRKNQKHILQMVPNGRTHEQTSPRNKLHCFVFKLL